MAQVTTTRTSTTNPMMEQVRCRTCIARARSATLFPSTKSRNHRREHDDRIRWPLACLEGRVSGLDILWTLLGTALIIMAGTCLNNYIDRDLDKNMERTANRALPNGRLTPQSVLGLGLTFAIVGTIVLFFLINPLTAYVGLIGLFFYVVVYTMWLKAYFHSEHHWWCCLGCCANRDGLDCIHEQS